MLEPDDRMYVQIVANGLKIEDIQFCRRSEFTSYASVKPRPPTIIPPEVKKPLGVT